MNFFRNQVLLTAGALRGWFRFLTPKTKAGQVFNTGCFILFPFITYAVWAFQFFFWVVLAIPLLVWLALNFGLYSLCKVVQHDRSVG